MIFLSSQGLCREDYFGSLGDKAPNVGEGGKVFFCSESEGMIRIGGIFSGMVSFKSGQISTTVICIFK